MASHAEIVKLADLSRRGKISLNQAEGYMAKKGWKKRERDEALKYMDTVRREHHKNTHNSNKSGIGVYVMIAIILGMAALYYLSYSGIINLANS